MREPNTSSWRSDRKIMYGEVERRDDVESVCQFGICGVMQEDEQCHQSHLHIYKMGFRPSAVTTGYPKCIYVIV